ncbi:unnamed protein product [Mytilus edulis]|uniref:Endonuclease/exonuclease/phosphatase domain-containing protein n=1 Tax=Mytilus edulis TaxID=6550 RepID=A0A8S3S2R7_MYTED|nr:unnamed protein product [Mytilus edulis]
MARSNFLELSSLTLHPMAIWPSCPHLQHVSWCFAFLLFISNGLYAIVSSGVWCIRSVLLCLLLLINSSYIQYLRFLKSDSEFVQWIEISNQISSLDQHTLFGCTYVPPEFSKYSSDESFIEIEEELLKFSQGIKNIVIVGDFNARTSSLKDYVDDDINLQEILQIEEDIINDNTSSYSILKENNILQRFNKDTGRVNKYGTKLLDFCKRCNLFIANGRLFSDNGIGHTTCKDASMVDYLLLSPNSFNITTDFEIIDFNPMFSDVHNRVHLQ